MYLYNMKRGSFFKILSEEVSPSEVYYFKHIDGMYSVCYNSNGSLIHINIMAPVKVVDRPEDWVD